MLPDSLFGCLSFWPWATLPSGSVTASLSPVFTGQWFTRGMTAVVSCRFSLTLWVYGHICRSSMVHSSPSPSEAPLLRGDSSTSGGSYLASASVVCGPPPAVCASSSTSTVSPRPFVPASVLGSLSGYPQASPSCLMALRRFPRAAGFS